MKVIKLSTIVLIILLLNSCTNSKEAHYKVWDNYKTCSAYGNP